MNILNQDFLKAGSYINGQWIDSGRELFSVKDPSNGKLIQELADATEADALAAVSAASEALPKWQAFSANERSEILLRWFELVMDNKDDLAAILTAEQGKPLKESVSEIIYGANYIQWFAEEAKRVYGDVIPSPSNDKRVVVIKQAVGVVSAITPWNFPSSMITRKAAPALAAGCTFIIKGAAETPLSAIALAVLAEKAGIPAGVFNVLVTTDSRGIGKVLTGDKRIAKFSFTGSTPVGKILLKQCADTVKKTSMELGGNAPFIIFDDADIDAAIDGVMISKYRNAGQTCVCSNRILVQASIYDEFAERLIKRVNDLCVSDGFTENVDMGPLIHKEAADSVNDMVENAKEMGAKVLAGGGYGELGGSYYQPTVLGNVTSEMQVFRQEIFGPVAPLIKFNTEEEAIKLANDTEFGLASYIYARDIGRVWRVSEALEYGMVGINEGIISNPAAPFGGVKESGMGREGSKYGMEDYLEIKYLCMGGI